LVAEVIVRRPRDRPPHASRRGGARWNTAEAFATTNTDSGRIGADRGNEIDVEFWLWNWIYRHVPPSTWNDGAGQEITITDCSFVPQRP